MYYPIKDFIPSEDLQALGLKRDEVSQAMPSLGMTATVKAHKKFIKAKATGEKRPPKAGEWYISGAIPEAYRAPNDLSQKHVIARLVVTRIVETEIEETY